MQYYQLSKNKLLDLMETSLEEGLHPGQIRRRQMEHGKNNLPGKNQKGIISIIADQFQDFMILVLMTATVLSLVMGEYIDAITIFAIIILNAIMGFVQEYRAERSLAALKQLAAPEAKIIRGSRLIEEKAEELVPGDVVLIETGDRVPADSRIMETDGIQVDESILTGESTPVSKTDKILYTDDLPVTGQKNILFMGTKVTRGQAKVVVVNTGKDTEMGNIAGLLGKENNNSTPLQKRLKNLGKWLVFFSILITCLIVFIGVTQGQSIYQMFMAGVSLAVAAIPEGLPAIVTLVLAMGVQKMIKRNAIVRRLPAVETLGCATVICSDKTGTLTENKMSLTSMYYNRKVIKFKPEIDDSQFDKIMNITALCNEARLKEKEKKGPLTRIRNIFTGDTTPDLIGDPTDIAFLEALYKSGKTVSELKESNTVIKKEPFDSSRKRMTILVEKKNGGKELWIKGAPEVIMSLCNYIEIEGQVRRLTSELKDEITRANDSMANQGLRVLAVAYKQVRRRFRGGLKEQENDLVLLGLTGLIDPPREEAYEAVRRCKNAGIRPIMITGDHKVTAGVIARKLGIIDRHDKIVTGKEVEAMSDNKLRDIVEGVNVFARINPEDKLRIVRALKDNGEVVAMTGDGVNDAPALKEAHIGVAMGLNGTDVTREVSSLILSDDNFATIIAAIEEGRKIYNNIRKFIRYLLSCNVGELLAIFMGITMGLPIPLIPIQILWVNLVTDGLPALALGMDEDSDDVMERDPRDPDESIFSHGMVYRIISQGLLIGVNTILVYLIALYQLHLDMNTARTMAFSTLVFSQLFFVFSCRSEENPFWSESIFSSIYLIGAVFISTVMQLAVIYFPFFSRIFQTEVLNLEQWFIVIVLSIWSTVFLELIHTKLFNR